MTHVMAYTPARKPEAAVQAHIGRQQGTTEGGNAQDNILGVFAQPFSCPA